MKKAEIEKIVLHMTPEGLKILKLRESELPEALERLKNGLQPEGALLADIPEYARSLAFCLKSLGKGWMLLDSDGELKGQESAGQASPISVEQVEEALDDIAEDVLEQNPDFEHLGLPHGPLLSKMNSLIEDPEQLEDLYSEVKRFAAVQLGYRLGDQLISRMGLVPEPEESSDRIGSQADLKELRKDLADIKEALGDQSENVAIGQALDTMGTRMGELSLILPKESLLADSQRSYRDLRRALSRFNKEFYRDTGFTVPELMIEIRPASEVLPEGARDDLSECPQLSPDEFVLARRRKTIIRSKFSGSTSAEMVEQIKSEVTDMFANSVHEWLTIDQVSKRFRDLESDHSGLLQEFKDAGGRIRHLLPLLKQLLKRTLPILDLVSILEIWLEFPDEERLSKMVEHLTDGERW